MIVVDASIAVKWAVEEPGSIEARRLLDIEDELGCPDVLFAEIANVMRKKVRGGSANAEQATQALRTLKTAVTMIEPAADLCEDALRFALSLDHSAYDCFYLAMAARRGELVTSDEAFVRKCQAHGYGHCVKSASEMLTARASQQREGDR